MRPNPPWPDDAPRRCLLVSSSRNAQQLRGAERQLLLLARGLAARGWEARVLAPGPSRLLAALREGGVPCGELTIRPEFSLAAFRRLRREIGAFQPSVLHLNDPHAIFQGVLVRLFRCGPLVVAHRRTDRASYHGLKYRWGADGVIAVSRAIAAGLAARGLAASRLAVVHSCVDPVFLGEAGSPAGARRELDLPPDAFVFLMAGAMVFGKEQDVLIRAFAEEFAGDGRAVLLLAGDGDRRAALESLARECGVGPRVRFTGMLEGPRLLHAYRAADAFVLATRFEGLPGSVLEAQALALPVAASDVPGVTEAVVAEETAVLTPAGDVAGMRRALRRLRDDAALRARLAAAGRARVLREFSADAMVDGVLAAYARFRAAVAG